MNNNLTSSRKSYFTPQTTQSTSKAVFAHFMVGNVVSWTIDQWKADMQEAQKAHIDAFALNMAYGADGNRDSVQRAVSAAGEIGFKILFSFDYAGNGSWPKDEVTYYIDYFGSLPTYFQYNGPLVSTFEGPGSVNDWVTIKEETGCFFMPSWSSLGAAAALKLGVADGLFSWAGWPWGDTGMDTYVDASYLDFLGQAGKKPYMMPVSPWFYMNLLGYDEDWLWRGDDLWYDRWQEVLVVQPDLVEIISWNDYGESHYIGPLHDDAYGAFSSNTGRPPYNYAAKMPHDGWRLLLPYVIDMYKKGTASITRQGLVGWYRLNPGISAGCSSNGTTGNTASQLQIEFQPGDVMQNKIFFSALLVATATVIVTVGGVSIQAAWTNTPSGGIGIYHGSASIDSNAGQVIITVAGSGTTMTLKGEAITTACQNGIANWNAWVGSTSGSTVTATSPKLTVSQTVCTKGTAPGNFKDLCAFTCSLGYYPIGACQCLEMGPQPTLPKATGTKGYPLKGEAICVSSVVDWDSAQSQDAPVPVVVHLYSARHQIRPIKDTLLMVPTTQVYAALDDTSPACNFEPPCDLTIVVNSFSDLSWAADFVPSYCVDNLAVQLLSTMLDNALNNFTLIDTDYDKAFNAYSKTIPSMVTSAIGDFMNDVDGPGNKYFTCTWNVRGSNTTSRQCSFDQDSLGDCEYRIYYTLDDPDGFYSEFNSTYGIDQTWLVFGENIFDQEQNPPSTHNDGCTRIDQRGERYPLVDPNLPVPNPKDIISKVMANTTDLQTTITATQIDLILGQWGGTTNEVVQVVSMPVFMIIQAIESMQQVKALGQQIEAAKEKDLILTILGAVFCFVPFLGPLADVATSVKFLASTISLIGDVGNAGLTIVDIIDDPTLAPLAIMGLLMGGGSRTEDGFSNMANLRRAAKPEDLAKIGTVFKKNDDDLQNLVKACKA
ncbi:hypothetical protein MMC25_000931 [Agyrium rufum]|nr:hypothetical protein [Agyrium rufum]